MKYSTPELVVLGSAASLVLGDDPGKFDSADPENRLIVAGLAVGLDD